MMSRSTIFLGLLLFPLFVIGHGPTPQKAKESIIINASVDKVWALIGRFDQLAEWHPDVQASQGDGKHKSGGARTLTFHNGEKITEELDFYSDKDHEYSYRLKTENVKALPVSSYSITVQVKDEGNGTASEVLFKSRFYRGDTGNTPPENLNDMAAVNAMNHFFKNGLEGLKQKLEQ